MSSVAGLERDRAVGSRGSRAELARLADGAAGELGAADAGREAEVVLDPARRSGLAAERGALDDQRVEPLGGAVDGGGEAGGAAADDEQVDFLARRQLASDPERAQHLASRGVLQLGAAREPHERRLRSVRRCGLVPGEREPVGAGEVEHLHRRLGRARSDDLEADPLDALERLPAGDEGREDEVAERSVVEQECAQRVAVDRDVAQRLGHDRGQEDGLPGEEVQLAEEAGGAVADDLVAGRIEDRDLALTDGDERIGRISDAEQHVADGCAPLFARRGECRQLRGGERRGWRELPSGERSRALSVCGERGSGDGSR